MAARPSSDDAGHCPQIEQPDAVNELLLDFLDGVTRERTAS